MPNINQLNKVKFLTSCANIDQIPKDLKNQIVFCGRSNVGKSSLINSLCNNKNLCKTSSTPGKTTLINFFETKDFYIVDLPGYGFANKSKKEVNSWKGLIEDYFKNNKNISLVFLLIDIRHSPSNLDKQMNTYLNDLNLYTNIILTKSDKLSKQKSNNQKKLILEELNFNNYDNYITVSSVNKSGIDAVKNKIVTTSLY